MMNWQNNLTAQLDITYPIVQAPMLGVSTPAMAAAVSNEGGLGSLAVGGLPPQKTLDLIRQTKSLTSRPFAVNLFAHTLPAYTEEAVAPMRRFLLQLAQQRGYALTEADLSGFQFHTYHEQLPVLLQEGIRIVSFTFGVLDRNSIRLLKEQNGILIGTATCLEEARILEEQGIDIIVAQGIEAGGHRGSFLEKEPLSQVGLFSLVPQLVKHIPLPIIAAGGIYNPQTIKAALDLGASGVQVGTAFITSEESLAIPAYRQRLATAKDTDTVLTRAFSGRWARGLSNELMQAISASGLPIPPYPVQNSFIGPIRKAAQQANDSGFTTLWAGQSAGAGTETASARDIFRSLVAGSEKV